MTLQVPITHHYYVRRALILFSYLDIAVVLSNSLPSTPDNDIFSAPQPEEDAQFVYPEKDEDMTEEVPLSPHHPWNSPTRATRSFTT